MPRKIFVEDECAPDAETAGEFWLREFDYEIPTAKVEVCNWACVVSLFRAKNGKIYSHEQTSDGDTICEVLYGDALRALVEREIDSFGREKIFLVKTNKGHQKITSERELRTCTNRLYRDREDLIAIGRTGFNMEDTFEPITPTAAIELILANID